MHVLICGLGSIGRRHLRHFKALGVAKTSAFRTGKARLPDQQQPQPDVIHSDLDTALSEKPDIVVVANPTSMHLATAVSAVEAGCHVLIEKPVSHSLNGLERLDRKAKSNNCIVSVAQNMRYHPQLRKLKQWIDSGDPLGEVVMLRAHFGAYLPDWHPWENYRDSYAARQALGGGCRRTHIHEIDYSVWMLGGVESIHSLESPKHPLHTDVDEATGYLLRFSSGAIATLTLSLCETPPSRAVDVMFTRGKATLDLLSGKMIVARTEGHPTNIGLPSGFDIDHTYRDQNAEFLKAVKENLPAPVPIPEASEILRIALF